MSLYVYICIHAVILLCSYFPRTFLGVCVCVCVCVFVCVCRLTGFVESVEESEGLRRDGAWELGVLQQRAAGEAPLHEPPHVSLLILLAPAQASTRGTERQRVRRAAHWGSSPDPAQDVSTVPQVRWMGLVGQMSRSLVLTVLFGPAPTTELCL